MGFGFDETKNPLVEILFLQKIPTRNGIHLSATIYKPANKKEDLPAIMQMTPYGFDGQHGLGMFFAQNGYTLYLWMSEGEEILKGLTYHINLMGKTDMTQ